MRGWRIFYLLGLMVMCGLFFGALQDVHPFGEPVEPAMDDYFLERAQEERAVNNVVTSIVFDYRGFDTLGEAAVLFTAVTSVVALFRKGGHER